MAGSDLVVNLGLNATAFTRGLTSASAKLGVLGVAAGKTGLKRGGGIMNMGFMNLNRTLSITKGLVGGIALGIVGMSGKALQMAAHTEQMRISFEVLAGNADIGNALFSEMEDLAQNTSLTIAETTQAAKKLMLSFDPRNIKGIVTTLGNISSGMDNVSLQDMAMLLQTSREEGKLLQRDLRQFSSRGIGLGKELQKNLGLVGPNAGEELDNMITAGKIGFQEVMDAVNVLGSNNMLERQANTLTGAFNQSKDAIGLVIRDFGEVLMKTLGITNFLKSMKDGAIRMREAIRSNLPVVQMMIETVKAFGSMVIQVFSDAASVIGILSGTADMTTTQIIEGFVVVMATVKHVFKNWRGWATLTFLVVFKAVETMVADIEHAFTVKLPGYLGWFADNWKAIWFVMMATQVLVLTNFMQNVVVLFVEIGKYIKSWGASGWNPMFVSLDRGVKEMKDKYGPEDLPNFEARGQTALEKSLDTQIGATAGTLARSLEQDQQAALARLRGFTPDPEGPGLGAPFAEDFGGKGKGKGIGKDKVKKTGEQKLGAMQRGSKEAIGAVIKAMGGREKTPELVELKRQTMMLKYFGDQLKREERYAELHPQGPI